MNRYFLIFLLLLCGCSTLKESMVVNGNKDDAIKNAIFDFIHTESKLLKDDKTFFIHTENVEGYIGVRIMGDPNKISLIVDIVDNIKNNTIVRVGVSNSISVIDTIDNDTVYQIIGEDNPVIWLNKNKVSVSYRAFPTGVMERNGKLFFWYDETQSVTDTIINTLYKYNFVDTMIVNMYIPDRIINDAKKGADYYFCKDNLSKYKKVITNRAIGHYKPPKLKCKD
jgi:hypothetical protein